MKKKMSDKKKLMSYVLKKDPDYNVSMTKIASIFDVSQSTVSNAIKEVTYQKKIYDLTNELENAKNEIHKLESQNERILLQPLSFSNDDDENDMRIVKVKRIKE